MQEIMDRTMVNGKKCIDFVPLSVGYYGSNNRISDVTLGNGCLRKGTVMHEILHALGFWHEQSRSDRDNYVTIHWENIQRVMHYSAYAFAVNRRMMTIEPKQPGVTIGQRVRLSDIDAKEIQILYGCIPRPTSTGVTSEPVSHPAVTKPPSVTHVTIATTCTFDSGLCGWHQSTEDNVDWNLGHGNTPSANTGPHADHTGSTSAHYLFMESSGHYHQRAILESGTYTPGYYCFSAYYNMNGNTMGTLTFNLVENGHKYTFKHVSGNHHDVWYHFRVGINVHTYNFKLQIEGYTGSSYRSDMAIDDITVSPGHCTH
ncbi:hypothetical protein KUTeg_004192 [Tegillarca granosa]|uniref:Metalloendopeptidase n=1 Tax=Tegillarca granosa TaxID=220873 RepID=A0ABQ9FP90_TEGGR|nr:hypothetical protein KUTeg_004192 [Tegillarca granosa]